MMIPSQKKRAVFGSQLFLGCFELTLPNLWTLLALCQLGHLCSQRSWENWGFDLQPQVTGWLQTHLFQSLFGTWVCKCLYRYKGENRRWQQQMLRADSMFQRLFQKLKLMHKRRVKILQWCTEDGEFKWWSTLRIWVYSEQCRRCLAKQKNNLLNSWVVKWQVKSSAKRTYNGERNSKLWTDCS